jgi:hypothetical protein
MSLGGNWVIVSFLTQHAFLLQTEYLVRNANFIGRFATVDSKISFSRFIDEQFADLLCLCLEGTRETVKARFLTSAKVILSPGSWPESTVPPRSQVIRLLLPVVDTRHSSLAGPPSRPVCTWVQM